MLSIWLTRDYHTVLLYKMSLLIRRCKFDSYWRYLKLVNRIKLHELRAWSFTNLTCRNVCNAHANPSILDDGIAKRFLDHLANEYKNRSWKNNNLIDFIDLNASGDLLSERMQLIENIQNLHNLGKQI